MHRNKDLSHLHAELEAMGEDEEITLVDEADIEDVDDLEDFEYEEV